MKPKLIVKGHLIGLRFTKRLNAASRDVLKCWGFHWNSIARTWVANFSDAREAVAKAIAEGNYPGFTAC